MPREDADTTPWRGRDRRRTDLGKVVALVLAIASPAAGLLAGAYAIADHQIRRPTNEHNGSREMYGRTNNAPSHPRLREDIAGIAQRIGALEESRDRFGEALHQHQKTQRWLLWVIAGQMAAQNAPDRLKAKRAREARARYEGYIRDKHTPEEALRRAVGGGVP